MNKNNSTGSNKSVQIVKTPDDFMAVVNHRWDIAWDLACTPDNALYSRYLTTEMAVRKHDRHLRTLKKGAFSVKWHLLSNKYLWLNPPYCNAEPACEPDCDKIRCQSRDTHNKIAQPGIAKWMEKCRDESKLGAKIITLTLASLGANWYKDFVEGNANVWILRERLKFIGHKDVYPKDLMIAEWSNTMNSFGHWSWKTEAKRLGYK